MNKSLNILALIDDFEGRVKKQLRKLEKTDAPALNALYRKRGTTEARCKAVKRWMYDYKVHRQKELKSGAVSKAIVKYADSAPRRLDPDPANGDYKALIREFVSLHKKLSSVIKPSKGGNSRDVTSLTSKALWCCYPKSVPIFDSRACRSLQVISAQLGLPRAKHHSDNVAQRYKPYVHDWFRVFSASGLMDRGEIEAEYRGRMLDNILWQLGEARY